MSRVAFLGPPERDEHRRLALRLEERRARMVTLDPRADPELRLGPELERACGEDLSGLRGLYVADLGLPSSIVRDAAGAVDAAASARALASSRRRLAAWNALLERVATHATVVNPPRTHDLHGLKPWEMQTARERGWAAPATWSTSDPAALLTTARAHEGRLVRKGMVGGYGYTSLFGTPADEGAARALTDDAPVMVQERVEGDNVRAFVVGSGVVGAATVVPRDGGEVDSRRQVGRLTRIELPEEARRLAVEAAEHWGLLFCAVDFMHEAATGRFVLLECNSAPFFVNFERATGVDVSSALADLLLGGADVDAALHEGELRTPLLQQIRATLRAEVDPDFGFVAPGPPAFTRLARPLAECRVALVTTAGFHLADDAPFRALEERLGDTSFRVVPHDAPDAALALDAPYVEQKHAPRDPEVALPRRALEELAHEGVVAAPAARHYSFVGGVVRPLPGLDESAARLAALLREDAVDAVVLLPTCSLCVQTVALVARALEQRGLATVCLSLIPELSEIAAPPRTLCVRFPFGAPAGDAGNAALHRAVLREALALVADAAEGPALAHSDAKWRR